MITEAVTEQERVKKQIGDLLCTGDVKVQGQKERWMYLSPEVFGEWKDIPHLQLYAARDAEVDGLVTVKLAAVTPGTITVAEKRFLRFFTRNQINLSRGYVAMELVTHPRVAADFWKSWEYKLRIPHIGSPELTVLEEEIHYHPDEGDYREMWGPKERTMSARPSDLEAFSMFLSHLSLSNQ